MDYTASFLFIFCQDTAINYTCSYLLSFIILFTHLLPPKACERKQGLVC